MRPIIEKIHSILEGKTAKVQIGTWWSAAREKIDRAVVTPGIYMGIALIGFIFEFLIELPFVIALYLSDLSKTGKSRK